MRKVVETTIPLLKRQITRKVSVTINFTARSLALKEALLDCRDFL